MLNTLPIWQKNHIEDCHARNMFLGKDVLEVGGETSPEIAEHLGAKSWTCVDPAFHKDEIISDRYKKIKQPIEDFCPNEKYDLIFSTNCFEHIQDLEKAFDNMYEILNDGGFLSALLGPIYSCYKGHHIYIYYAKDLVLDFNDSKLQDWGHLLYGPEKLIEILSKFYNEQTLNTIKEQLTNWDYINKLFFDDYIEIINNSKFKVIELRDWHKSKYPSPEIQKILEEKYNKKNFSTVSIKMILQK